MGDIEKVIQLIDDDDEERRVSAALVLGALKTKSVAARKSLLTMLEREHPNERRAAARALGEIGATASIPALVARVLDPAESVRAAATEAVRSFGEDAVPQVESALKQTSVESERAHLSELLAMLGGVDAIAALLTGLNRASEDAARAAALRFRQAIKGASAAERKRDRLVVEGLLFPKKSRAKAKAASKKASTNVNEQADVATEFGDLPDPIVRVAAVKILGYLEDKNAVPALLKVVANPNEDDRVRAEAVVALRFALGKERRAPDVQLCLVDMLATASPTLGRAAMDTLQNLTLDADAAASLAALAQQGTREIAQFSILALGSLDDKRARRALIDLVRLGFPAERAKTAAMALHGDKRAVPMALDVLQNEDLTEGSERVLLFADILNSVGDAMTPSQLSKLVDVAVARVDAGSPGYESIVKIARGVAPEPLADGLRALVSTLRRRKNNDKAAAVLGLLEKGDAARPEDKFRHAVIALSQSRKDTRPQARGRDPALKLFTELLDDGLDVAKRLAKERTVDDEARFYLGWHFIEEGHSFGEELLDDIIARKPRTKLARMAKNKKALELEA